MTGLMVLMGFILLGIWAYFINTEEPKSSEWADKIRSKYVEREF